MKITKRFNRVITPLNCSTSNPKCQISKNDPRLNPKSKPKRSRAIKKKTLTLSDSDANIEENLNPAFIILEKPPKILSFDFYQIDALHLAPQLLGKYLKKDDVVLQITEVEAYRSNDSACHSRVGITSRTAPSFGPGGHALVYLCYGMHNMLNIVADKEGIGSAVLIRSCAPISGLETIKQRRGLDTEKPVLLTGPGKVGQALGLTTEWSNHALFTPGGLEILDGPEVKGMVVGPRVGIDYALPEHVSALWRFAIAGSPWISAPKNTLRPPLSSG
ncbi:DNA-3-methyladenine glycosylase-like [Rutidosis leptorrhynchoides]|uniref:DNA-3-methyladenine glycosylase-like n=1 Tax=Rutidosis leptorrhynchoides TaxID=125765 RepID=UPI003A99C69C